MEGSVLVRNIEALLVASPRPQSAGRLFEMFGEENVRAALDEVTAFWQPRGMNVVTKGDEIAFVPSKDAVSLLDQGRAKNRRRLTEAAVSTLCFIAFNQPVTVADIEKARGLALSKGLMDSLLDAGMVRAAMRKTNSGRAMMYVTTDAFLDHYALTSLADLPTQEEMEDMLNPPVDYMENDVPHPQDDTALGL